MARLRYNENEVNNMELIATMDQVIAYLEDHLKEDIDYHEVAKQVHYSSFHLHRVFSMLAGMSITQYVRNRRLSDAAIDLVTTTKSVLEIATDYRYDTPDGFQKAFLRFHGVNPTEVRYHGASVSCFHPLRVHLTYQGGNSMQYRLVPMEPFQLLVVSRTFDNDIIGEEDNTEIASFWEECLNNGTVARIQELTNEQDLYSPCASISPDSTTFRYGIGARYDKDAVDHFETWTLDHPLYAVFEVATIEDIGATWQTILQEFLPASSYQMADAPDFEFYPHNKDIACEIWVPVIRT
jgi:AraC family transcriptional regulator